jgi:serine/threonine protein kinase
MENDDRDATATPDLAATPNQLGDFQLVKKLGSGGMGTVYKAVQLSMDRDVALKILHEHLASDPNFVRRFYREAKTSGKLDHPGIVRGIFVGEDRGRHYFAMEFVEGENLDAVVPKQGRLPVRESVRLIVDVARALHYAHGKEMVHRDIKPGNIMVGDDGVVKLTDLGLARALKESNVTQSGEVFGTPAYMAPEQVLSPRDVDGRADIYALGVTLYVLLAGEKPFPADPSLHAILTRGEQPYVPARRHNPSVPEALDAVVEKALAPERERRFQTAAELADALEAIELPAENDRTAPRLEDRAPRERRASGLAVALGGALVALLVLVYLGWSRSAPSPSKSNHAIAERPDEVIAEALVAAAFGRRDEAVAALAAGAASQPQVRRLLRELNEGVLIVFQRQTPAQTGLLTPVWAADGMTLSGDDNYRLAFLGGRDCHVYAFQADQKPSITALFPNPRYGASANPIDRGGVRWVPAAEDGTVSWLQLDEQRGVEYLYFVATAEPLPDPSTFAGRLLEAGAGLQTDAAREAFARRAGLEGKSCFATEKSALLAIRLNRR